MVMFDLWYRWFAGHNFIPAGPLDNFHSTLEEAKVAAKRVSTYPNREILWKETIPGKQWESEPIEGSDYAAKIVKRD